MQTISSDQSLLSIRHLLAQPITKYMSVISCSSFEGQYNINLIITWFSFNFSKLDLKSKCIFQLQKAACLFTPVLLPCKAKTECVRTSHSDKGLSSATRVCGTSETSQWRGRTILLYTKKRKLLVGSNSPVLPANFQLTLRIAGHYKNLYPLTKSSPFPPFPGPLLAPLLPET